MYFLSVPLITWGSKATNVGHMIEDALLQFLLTKTDHDSLGKQLCTVHTTWAVSEIYCHMPPCRGSRENCCSPHSVDCACARVTAQSEQKCIKGVHSEDNSRSLKCILSIRHYFLTMVSFVWQVYTLHYTSFTRCIKRVLHLCKSVHFCSLWETLIVANPNTHLQPKSWLTLSNGTPVILGHHTILEKDVNMVKLGYDLVVSVCQSFLCQDCIGLQNFVLASELINF